MRYKLVFCFLFIGLGTVCAQDRSLKEIINEIEKETGFSFVYNENIDLSQEKTITISVKDKSPASALSRVFRDTGISWEINGKHIILQKEAKKINVSGYISDKSSSETLIGANIWKIGTNSGTTTNNYGYFTFSIPEGETELQISYIGYETKKSPYPSAKILY